MKNTPKKSEHAVWENRDLGASEKHIRKMSPAQEKTVDENIGMQAISIRLHKTLIDDLKKLAEEDGIGYQPYVRQLLTRHVRQLLLEKKEKRKVKSRKSHANINV